MGTRNAPGPFNCYAAALPDEEVFTVLGRDPATPATIRFWVDERRRLGKVVTTDDKQRIAEALQIADTSETWRAAMIEAAGDGDPIWRNRPESNYDDGPAIRVVPELRWGANPDEDGKLVNPLSASRICELLDYATCYGEFDENTPNGTISKYGESMSTPMNDIRRHAIWVYKKVLGLLDENAAPPPVEQHVSDHTVSEVAKGLLAVREEMLDILRSTKLGFDFEKLEKVSATFKPFAERLTGLAAQLALDAPVKVDTRSDYDRRAGAIGEMQVMGAPAREWLTRNGFENVKDFMDRATDGEIARWERFRNRQQKPGGRIDPYKEMAAIVSQEKAGLVSVEEGVEAKARLIGKHPSLAAGYGDKPKPTMDTAPEDLAHAPEVPAHRFSQFVKGENYAYARGLEVSPVHLPIALDAMSASGWHLVAIFGQTDSQHIGFIFERMPREIESGLELAHFGAPPESWRDMTTPVRWPEGFTGSDALDTERYRKD